MFRCITDLVEGESGLVINCENSRLLEHGFVPGTFVKVYKKVSETTSVYLRGAIIAARDKNYELVFVEKISK